MVRRTSKKSKAQIITIDLTRLTKDGLVVLQQYVDHGQQLPTVSSRTSYRDIWRHTQKFNRARKSMASLSSKVMVSSREASKLYSPEKLSLPKPQLTVFLETQSRLVDDLLDECDRIVRVCSEFEKESERDGVKLKEEVARLKVATNAQERRDLLLEHDRATPVVSQVKGHLDALKSILDLSNSFPDVFTELSDGLKAIQHELTFISESSSGPNFDRILYVWKAVLSSGVQLVV
ncbi:Adenylosuccinate lyase [Favolaschia claudopus]|uniref:Adenylosuccinate lyase n=1 Tax=Favolaschia claudopus TaxID=2862362 RepID=A0AAW0D8K9_9AGAR